MKVVFVYEHFFPPFDEGVKNFAFEMHQHYEKEHTAKLIRYFRILPNFLNSLLLVPRLLLLLPFLRPQKIVFIPQAALTFSSLLKLAILQVFYGSKLVAVGVQKRQLGQWQMKLLRRLKMPHIYVLSSGMAESLKSIGVVADIVNVGIDRNSYQPAADRHLLRNKYNIDTSSRVLLHVGHIKVSRNIDWLLEIKAALPELEIILVGSTATEQDNQLCQQLEQVGIRVLRDYLPDIYEVYQISDIYCFPVIIDTAAMETPLSVLEAMATNLPVITTPFGRLPEQFQDDNCYRYVTGAEEIIQLLNTSFGDHCKNREKTAVYSWQATAERLLT